MIERQLQHLLREYQRNYPAQWRDLVATIAHYPDEPVNANLDVYIWGFHLGGFSISVEDMFEKSGVPREKSRRKRLPRQKR